MKAGVDNINTDDLHGLEMFLRAGEKLSRRQIRTTSSPAHHKEPVQRRGGGADL